MNKKHNPLLDYKVYSTFVLLVLAFSLSQLFTGCSGSDDDSGINLAQERAKDSIKVYTKLEVAFSNYQKALSYNEAFQDLDSKNSFEAALRELLSVPQGSIESASTYQWKNDFEELSKSIVQDYFATQSNIDEKSSGFKLATRLNIDVEKLNKYTEEEATEPLPDGKGIPLVKNEAVQEYLDFFSKTDRGRSFMDKTLYRSGKYFPIIRKILKFNNAPEELIYLSVQESGLDPKIVSRAGAVGLWQFMPSTGFAYGLYQDEKRDDRKDFEKSTEAATKFTKDLYRQFDDWYLVMAAYNAGPGRIAGAMRKSGGKDYWSVRGYLPTETRGYVPSILALSFIFRNPSEYGFKNPEYGKPLNFDRVNIKGDLSFEKIAELSETDVDVIRELNPELASDNLPNYDVPYQLRIPHNSYNTFASNIKKNGNLAGLSFEFAGNQAYEYNYEVATVDYKIKGYSPDDKRKVGSVSGRKRIGHKLETGENLMTVSTNFSVRPTDLRLWNNIHYGQYPTPGQDLSIYLDEQKYNFIMGVKEPVKTETQPVTTPETKTPDKAPVIKNPNTPPEDNKNTEPDNGQDINQNNSSSDNGYVEEVKTAPVKKVVEKKKPVEKKVVEEKKGSLTIHVVKSGEYISTIAKEYDVTSDNIKEWNNIDGDKILIGQKLKIYSDNVPEERSDVKNDKNTKTVKGAKTYKVKSGDNLTMIADEYGVTVSQLRDWNDLESDVLWVNQVLTVKGGKEVTTKEKTTAKKKKLKTYKVVSGDRLADIAEENDISLKDIKKWNGLKTGDIMIGQVLKLYDPNEEETTKVEKKYESKTPPKVRHKKQY